MCVQCSHQQVVDLKGAIDLYLTNVKSCDYFLQCHRDMTSQSLHPQLWGSMLTTISMFCTLLFLGITLTFKSYTSQWKGCALIFNLVHSTHRHDYCIEVCRCTSKVMVAIATIWHLKWKDNKTYVLHII
jgi:hypothetical protein